MASCVTNSDYTKFQFYIVSRLFWLVGWFGWTDPNTRNQLELACMANDNYILTNNQYTLLFDESNRKIDHSLTHSLSINKNTMRQTLQWWKKRNKNKHRINFVLGFLMCSINWIINDHVRIERSSNGVDHFWNAWMQLLLTYTTWFVRRIENIWRWRLFWQSIVIIEKKTMKKQKRKKKKIVILFDAPNRFDIQYFSVICNFELNKVRSLFTCSICAHQVKFNAWLNF